MRMNKEIVEDFYDMAEGRVAISLVDGSYYEGYMFEILDNKFSFFLSGPLAPEEPIEIKFDDVDLNKLYYLDESEHKWKLAFGDNKNVHGK